MVTGGTYKDYTALLGATMQRGNGTVDQSRELIKRASDIASSYGNTLLGSSGIVGVSKVNEAYMDMAQKEFIDSGKGYMNNGNFTFATNQDTAHYQGSLAGGDYTDISVGGGSLLSRYTGGNGTLARKKKNLLAGYFGDTATLGV